MNSTILAASIAALASVASVEAGIFVYSAQEMTAGISSGGAGDEATYTGLDSWYGSRSRSASGFLQFATIGSSLMADQFSVTAINLVNATAPGFGGYDAYATYELDFTVTEDAIATIFVSLDRESSQGSILSFALTGPDGNVYAAFSPDETTFSTTMVAGEYRMIGLIWITAPGAGGFSNQSDLIVSVNAVAVPGPGTLALLGLVVGVGSRRRR